MTILKKKWKRKKSCHQRTALPTHFPVPALPSQPLLPRGDSGDLWGLGHCSPALATTRRPLVLPAGTRQLPQPRGAGSRRVASPFGLPKAARCAFPVSPRLSRRSVFTRGVDPVACRVPGGRWWSFPCGRSGSRAEGRAAQAAGAHRLRWKARRRSGRTAASNLLYKIKLRSSSFISEHSCLMSYFDFGLFFCLFLFFYLLVL